MWLACGLQDGSEVVMKAKVSMKMEKVINAWAQRKAVDPATVKLMFDGHRLEKDVMIADIDGLEDGMIIEVMQEMIGGKGL